MSWSYPRVGRERILVRAACAAGIVASAPLMAAQYYVQPSASISAENDSNLDLNPGGSPAVQGYIGDVDALFGIGTQNSDTSIRPHIDYRNYPSDSADNRLEEDLDLNSYYRSQRSKASVYFKGYVEGYVANSNVGNCCRIASLSGLRGSSLRHHRLFRERPETSAK